MESDCLAISCKYYKNHSVRTDFGDSIYTSPFLLIIRAWEIEIHLTVGHDVVRMKLKNTVF